MIFNITCMLPFVKPSFPSLQAKDVDEKKTEEKKQRTNEATGKEWQPKGSVSKVENSKFAEVIKAKEFLVQHVQKSIACAG